MEEEEVAAISEWDEPEPTVYSHTFGIVKGMVSAILSYDLEDGIQLCANLAKSLILGEKFLGQRHKEIDGNICYLNYFHDNDDWERITKPVRNRVISLNCCGEYSLRETPKDILIDKFKKLVQEKNISVLIINPLQMFAFENEFDEKFGQTNFFFRRVADELDICVVIIGVEKAPIRKENNSCTHCSRKNCIRNVAHSDSFMHVLPHVVSIERVKPTHRYVNWGSYIKIDGKNEGISDYVLYLDRTKVGITGIKMRNFLYYNEDFEIVAVSDSPKSVVVKNLDDFKYVSESLRDRFTKGKEK